MKKTINRYLNFIGITNEGYKRLTIITIIIFGLYFPLLSGYVDDFNTYKRIMLFDSISINDQNRIPGQDQELIPDKYYHFLFLNFLILFPSPIIVGIIVKVTNWVKDGFKK
jgi:hypothetical protein